MSDARWNFDTFNAKRMSAPEIASTFVPPRGFDTLAGADHYYIIGPRGSGKTTLLRMLHGEALMAWKGRQADAIRKRVSYSTVFLPADNLWASQTSGSSADSAFSLQLLYALVETMMYRTQERDSQGNLVHQHVEMDAEREAALVRECAAAWGLSDVRPSLVGLQAALDLALVALDPRQTGVGRPSDRSDPMRLLTFGIRAFNRAVGQPDHKWALLLDEMELAPSAIHKSVVSFVRGGAPNLILKLSMSPFDRYMELIEPGVGPMPGNDFQTLHLAGQPRRDIWRLTEGLWRESMRSRGFRPVPMTRALGSSSIDREPGTQRGSLDTLKATFRRAQQDDAAFAQWLRAKKIDISTIDELSYSVRSSTVRKVYPLLVFRESILTFRGGKPASRRGRKKSLEPFTGASAVTTALEGNPRWIKTAFAEMLNFYDEETQSVARGVQFDALSNLANRFEALLRVLPQSAHVRTGGIPVSELVDAIATYLNERNTGEFTPDPPTCFIADQRTGRWVNEALALGLYAGAFVHVRDRRSPDVVGSLERQRFRLAYLLGIRDYKEFPLRLGKDVSLASVLATRGDRTSRTVPAGHEQPRLEL